MVVTNLVLLPGVQLEEDAPVEGVLPPQAARMILRTAMIPMLVKKDRFSRDGERCIRDQPFK